MKIGGNIYYYRKRKGFTQEELAEKLGVTFQTVSAWERDDYLPQLDKLDRMAQCLDVTIADLCSSTPVEDAGWVLKDQMFSVEHMYRFVRTYAQSADARQTTAALPYAKERHEGQFRKGKGKVPYIYHPLVMTCHALALGFHEDDLTAALLLHDVCEDCRDEAGNRIKPENLPVGEKAQEAVRLVTKPDEEYDGWEKDYYSAIAQNRLAVIVKCLDRCNNISMMAVGFSRAKMREYIVETETYVLPLLEIMKKKYEDTCYNAAFLIKYQMLSDLENLKRLL